MTKGIADPASKAKEIPPVDARGLLDVQAARQQDLSNRRAHAASQPRMIGRMTEFGITNWPENVAGLGLAPLREEGEPICVLCDSTACEHVGGAEACTVSPIFHLTPMGDGNQVYRCTECGFTPEQVRVGGHADRCKHHRKPQPDHTHDSGEFPRR